MVLRRGLWWDVYFLGLALTWVGLTLLLPPVNWTAGVGPATLWQRLLLAGMLAVCWPVLAVWWVWGALALGLAWVCVLC